MNLSKTVVRSGVLALAVTWWALAGCTQRDVSNADSAFHKAAQSTHDAGKDIAQGANHAAKDIKKDSH